MKYLLNEEVKRMQHLAGIENEETFESVLKNFLLEIELHETALKENKVLNESLWEKAKYYLGKLGRYKVNGKFLGKNKELEASRKRVDDLINKEANAKIKELIGNIKKYVPEFPNNESSEKFLDTLLHIGKFYDGIVAATQKDPEDEEFMPIDMANELINDLRAYIKHVLDAELKSSYTTFNEAEEDNKIGDIENYDKRAKKDLLKRRAGKEEFSSERMKTLKSWKLPLALFGAGGALGGISWLLDLLKSKADLVHVLKGEGMTQILNRVGERGDWSLPKIDANTSLDTIKDYITKVGEGDYSTGIDRLTADNGMFQDPDAARQALEQMSNANGSTTAGNFFQGKLAGTGKIIGDMLVTKAFGPLLLKAGTSSIAPVLGSFASGLGVVLIAGSVATALARLKGRKSSRAASLNMLYQSLKNIKPTEENPTVVSVENTPGGPPQVDNTSTSSQENIPSDVTAISKDIESNNSLKTTLNRINNEEELADLLVASVKYVNKDFQKSSEDNAAFNDVAKEVPKFYTTSTSSTPKTFNYSVVKEEEKVEQDVINVEKIIGNYPTLKNHLEKINNREELKQLILKVIFPNVDPKLAQNQSRISTAIQKARNILAK